MVVMVVSNTSATVQSLGMLYKTVLQSVLLYGSELLVVTRAILKVLEVFHHWKSRSITGMTPWCTTSGKWGWPPVAEALETTGPLPIKEYVQWIQDTIASQVA